MKPGHRVILLPLILGAVVLLAGACGEAASASGDDPAPGKDAAGVALDQGAVVIDVRTPEEYAEGHVEGAELIDVQSAEFASQIADLDPEAQYVVYCRSGNRSAAAAAQMRDADLDVLDGGSLDDMLAAGWPGT
ncbi:MAG: rhodanese-like domain-containing protein [Microthrixaceae bacterium]|nr:rhodanese-like domain-containing protein [Microthrixaceae bacterium]